MEEDGAPAMKPHQPGVESTLPSLPPRRAEVDVDIDNLLEDLLDMEGWLHGCTHLFRAHLPVSWFP